eukprot:Phypoly_transcript_21510.p1 GENE.Phypoly_transcript_21510~~Phypoly_transcript_21510.p1  ORF type:complete len:186 (+),score=43.82 Phypoly_transcript_21510:53-610(+)
MATAAAKKRWTNLFTLLDVNKNGTIEKGDAKAAVQAIGKGGYFTPQQLDAILAAATQLLEGFIKVAENKNGHVTQAQFLAGAENLFFGKPFESAPKWWKQSVKQIFDLVDKNGNGVISEEEFVTFATGITPSVSASVAKAAFEQFEGPVNRPAVQKAVWTWLSSGVATIEDTAITLAVNEQLTSK